MRQCDSFVCCDISVILLQWRSSNCYYCCYCYYCYCYCYRNSCNIKESEFELIRIVMNCLIQKSHQNEIVYESSIIHDWGTKVDSMIDWLIDWLIDRFAIWFSINPSLPSTIDCWSLIIVDRYQNPLFSIWIVVFTNDPPPSVLLFANIPPWLVCWWLLFSFRSLQTCSHTDDQTIDQRMIPPIVSR
jgi:hypothetical protein